MSKSFHPESVALGEPQPSPESPPREDREADISVRYLDELAARLETPTAELVTRVEARRLLSVRPS